MELAKSNLQKLALNVLWKHPNLLLMAQKCRYILMRGPWQSLVVKYLQLSSKLSRHTPVSYALPTPSLFPDLDVKRIVKELNENGYSIAFQLPEEITLEILMSSIAQNSDNIHHPHKFCTAFNEVVCDPNVISVARGYLGIEPILYGTRIYTSKEYKVVTEKMLSKKMVHFDVTDYKDLNLFIYLTDVDEDCSPHIVVEGTHKYKSFRDLIAQRYTRNEAQKKYGAEKFKTLTGLKGLAFFEDSSAFHIQSRGLKGRTMATSNYTMIRKPELARY